MSVQAELLSVSRSSLYDRPVTPSAAEIRQASHRRDLHCEPVLRLAADRGAAPPGEFVVNRNAVVRRMREMGIGAIGPTPKLSTPHLERSAYPYLLDDVVVSFPDHVWGIDLTYVRLAKGRLPLMLDSAA